MLHLNTIRYGDQRVLKTFLLTSGFRVDRWFHRKAFDGQSQAREEDDVQHGEERDRTNAILETD